MEILKIRLNYNTKDHFNSYEVSSPLDIGTYGEFDWRITNKLINYALENRYDHEITDAINALDDLVGEALNEMDNGHRYTQYTSGKIKTKFSDPENQFYKLECVIKLDKNDLHTFNNLILSRDVM